jgi:hypothetical protein
MPLFSSLPRICLIASIALGSEAAAVVVADPSNTVDTSLSPDAAFPWLHTGYIANGASGSATYLGDGWVLTAQHAIGLTNNVVLNGVTYQWNSSAGVVTLPSAPDLDLALIQIIGDPGLPSLDFYCEPVEPGLAVTMVGTGHFRESYNNNGTGRQNDDFYEWATRAQPVPETYWGTNTVAQVGVDDSAVPNHLFTTVFDLNGTTYEAQAAKGDSGGGVYVNNGGSWELAGMMFSASNLETQRATYGDESFFVDLSFYKAEINSLTSQPVPEPSSGFFVILAALAYPALRMRRR